MTRLSQVKEGKNFTLYTDGEKPHYIKIFGRFSYPAFGTKKRNEDKQTGKVRENWGGVLMLPKSTHSAAHAEFMQIIEAVKANATNPKTGKKGVIIDPANMCIKDGDNHEDESMHGHWLITFSDSQKQPAVRDSKGGLILDVGKIDAMFYGGCWGHVLLRPWYFNGSAKNDSNTYPKRISCGFTGVQFVKDDTPFGTGSIDDEDAWGSAGNTSGDDGLGDGDGDDEL